MCNTPASQQSCMQRSVGISAIIVHGACAWVHGLLNLTRTLSQSMLPLLSLKLSNTHLPSCHLLSLNLPSTSCKVICSAPLTALAPDPASCKLPGHLKAAQPDATVGSCVMTNDLLPSQLLCLHSMFLLEPKAQTYEPVEQCSISSN